MKTKFLAAAAACALSCGAIGTAQADIVPPYLSDSSLVQWNKRYETVFFTGLQWVFGANTSQSRPPQLVLGARYTETERNNHVTGAKIDIAIPLDDETYNMPTLRLFGLAGNRDAQAEAGFGLRLNGAGSAATPLFAAGVQVPYANFGAQFLRGADRPEVYVGLNTLAKPKAPEWVGGLGGELSCPDGLELYSLEYLETLTMFVPPEFSTDGYTCTLGGF